MKRPTPKTIDPLEWNFRDVPKVCISDCLLWELAREAPGRRRAIEAWLSTKIEGVTVKRRLRLPMLGFNGIDRVGDVIRAGRKAAGNSRLLDLLLTRKDFPRPWATAPKTRLVIRDSNWCSPPLIAPLRDSLNWYIQHVTPKTLEAFGSMHYHAMLIEVHPPYGRDVESMLAEIVKTLRPWLKAQLASRPEARKRGAQAHVPMDELRSLVAHRLHKAGFTYDAAHAWLEPHKQADYAPHCCERSWSRYLQRARELLEQTERDS